MQSTTRLPIDFSFHITFDTGLSKVIESVAFTLPSFLNSDAGNFIRCAKWSLVMATELSISQETGDSDVHEP
jgi:hypothetical protein